MKFSVSFSDERKQLQMIFLSQYESDLLIISSCNYDAVVGCTTTAKVIS